MQASRPVHQTAVSLLPSLFGGGGGGEGCGGSQKLACIKPCGEMEWEWGWCINIIDGPVQNWMAVISLVLMGASCPVLTSWHGGTFPCLNRCSYWPYAPHWTTWAYSWAMLRGHVRWEGFFFFFSFFFLLLCLIAILFQCLCDVFHCCFITTSAPHCCLI